MGSKTPEGEYEGPNGLPGRTAIADVNPPRSAAASGLLPGSLTEEDEDGDGDDDEAETTVKLVNNSEKGKRKKRKNKKHKKKSKSSRGEAVTPPTVAVHDLFKREVYPKGEVVEYSSPDSNLKRTTAEEVRHLAAVEKMDGTFIEDYRKAAEAHRRVRQYVQTIAKPGVAMTKLADAIEDGVRVLVGHQGIETGDALKAWMGFPTGLALNNVAAHWTPDPGAKDVILQYDDVLKIDIGVHVNGRIVDSAFTVAANPVYDDLLAAVTAATNVGLKEAGIDARIDHISEVIQETMESYEVELNGEVIPIKAVQGLTGHDILRYKIHGEKQVPFVKTKTNQRMEEGDVFAIETFGSTGSGHIREDVGVYGYRRNDGVSASAARTGPARSLVKVIDDNFGTLVFSKRYLEHLGVKNYHLGMKSLLADGIVEYYEPLVDISGSYVAQFEHTILLRPNCKEVISRGDDY